MLLQILKLDAPESDILTTFSTGLHTIGRGPLLDCNDKRISRNHAEIEITSTEAKITSTHLNPCFIKLANSKTITILPKDATNTLEDGDKFAFLPDCFWFKVKVVMTNETLKREIIEEDLSSDTPVREKRIKIEAESTDEPSLTSSNNNTTPNEEIFKVENAENQAENNCENPPETEPNTITEPNASSLDTQPAPIASSSTNILRDRCKYGQSCYRKNPDHKAEFSHPGDADYDSDPNDTRPLCKYGVKCFRKKLLHRQKYRHLNMDKKKRAERARRQNDYQDDYDDEEEDPFYGEDSDAYEPTSEDSDDWEDSVELIPSDEFDEEDDNDDKSKM